MPLIAVPAASTFRDLIRSNKRKSALLVVFFCLLVPLIAAVVVPLGIAAFAGAWLQAILLAHEELTLIDLCIWIAGGAGFLSLVYCVLMYRKGDEFVLRSVAAHPITKDENPELYNVVEEVSIAADLPMPRVYMIDDPAANALATGRDPCSATIAVTTGLQRLLNRDELQAVVAHEISHIRNYDTRVMLLTATLVGSVAGICDFFIHMARCICGGRFDEYTPRWVGLFVLVSIGVTIYWLGWLAVAIMLGAAIALLILAPLSAHLIQLAVSREREFLADATAVELTRHPQPLADALWKLHRDKLQLRDVSGATAHLFISNPIKRFRRLGRTVFASHPPLKERIRRIAMLA